VLWVSHGKPSPRGYKKAASLRPLAETLAEAEENDVLELDEVCSFVQRRANKRWLWTALCRRTRQMVAFVIGDRSEAICRRLWEALPAPYRRCQSYSDLWAAYGAVFDATTHQQVGKETGQTAHIERWNNTLRQRNARYVRKTLAFSKTDE
jgi:IS1 family transposase